MSLINKMLQDLDARGSTGAGAMRVDIKPVLRDERRLSLPLALGLLAGAAAIAAAGAFGWRYLQKPPTRAAVATKPAVVLMRSAPQVLPVAQPVATTPANANTAPEQRPAEPGAASPVGWAGLPPTRTAAEPSKTAITSAAAELPAKPVVPAARRPAPESDSRLRGNDGPAVSVLPPARRSREGGNPIPSSSARPAQAVAGTADARRGEDAYRRALVSLQDGRVTEALASLEQALQLEPRHDAARQTLIGLLVESGRADEAMRQLQQALAVDARQPALAMLLARLQIERGGSGVETLTRTLPYAGGNGEYQAFLAGALQRQGRNLDAAEQYQAALRSAPANGVWWMGLGISLQADKRDADARTAFRRAQAAGTLSPELQAFVERKLQQLAR